MNKTFFAVVALAVICVVAGAWYYRYSSAERSAQPLEIPEAPIAPEVSDGPVILHPVPELPAPVSDDKAAQQIGEQVAQEIDIPPDPAAEAESPLPQLDDSDKEMRDALADITEPRTLDKLFTLDGIIRRFVVTIDNMPGKKLPQRHIINKPAEGRFLTAGEEGAEYINADNYERYTPYIRLLDSMDTQKIASLYIRFYPLFQAAYVDLGYPSAYFNDRLIEVIDHLLATPDVQGRIKLVRPHVLYKFANPELEALSAGQKVLVRIGHSNAVRVKSKLRELRQALTVQEPAP